MNRRTKTYLTNAIWSLILSMLTGSIMMFLLQRTGLPAGRFKLGLVSWLFPLLLMYYSILPIVITDRLRRHRVIYTNQWFSVWVIPFLLLGISWKHLGSWLTVFSVFYWIYIISHVMVLMVLSQTADRPKKIGFDDIALFLPAAIALNIWRSSSISADIAIHVFTNAVLTVSAAVLIGLLSEKMSGHGYAGSFWQRWLIMLTMLSVPFLSSMNQITVFHVFCVMIACSLLFMRSAASYVQLTGFVIAGIVIVLMPVTLPSGVFLSFWLGVLIVLQNRRHQILEGILVPGAVVTLILIGVFVTDIRVGGTFPAGDRLYPLTSAMIPFSSLLDRSRGLIHVSPWIILGIAGWLVTFPEQKRMYLMNWLGFPLILAGLTAGEWIQTGQSFNWNQWIILLPVILPYYGTAWKKSPSLTIRAFVRVSGIWSLLVSGVFYVYASVTDVSVLDLARLTGDYAARTGIEISSVFPVFNHQTAEFSGLHWLWVATTAAVLLLLTVTIRFFPKHRKTHDSGILDVVLLTLVIFLMAAGIKSVQRWHVIPLKDDIIHIHPGQSWAIDTNMESNVVAVKIVSDLSRSTRLPQDHPVAGMVFVNQSGESGHKIIAAGVHTAEWAYNRPDVLRSVQHQRPEIAWSWNVEEPDGSVFHGLTYKSVFFLDVPERIKTIRISNPETHDTGHILTIRAMGLMKQKSGIQWTEPVEMIESPPLTLSGKNPSQKVLLSGEIAYANIILNSSLANAAHLDNGTPVGRITLKTHDGLNKIWLVRAGVDTAEWSWNRPDMIGRTRHSKPGVAYSIRSTDYPVPYLSHVYRGVWHEEPPVFVTEVLIEFLAAKDSLTTKEWLISGLILY